MAVSEFISAQRYRIRLKFIRENITLQLMAGSTNGSGGSSSSASGDPIISPLYGHPYQLPCDNNCYLLFDNQDKDQRLVINAQTWILPESERILVQKYADDKWGRECDILSYIKYIGVYWNKEWTIYDIDNLSIVSGTNNEIKTGDSSLT